MVAANEVQLLPESLKLMAEMAKLGYPIKLKPTQAGIMVEHSLMTLFIPKVQA